MANVPIVTSLTLAELEILVAANGLNPGLQYKVTDKDWLLIAMSNNTLYSVVIKLIAPDSLPSYINCETLLIECNVDVDTTLVHYIIPVPVGYYFILALIPSAEAPYFGADMKLQDPDENLIIPALGAQPAVYYPLTGIVFIPETIELVSGIGGSNVIGGKILLKFSSVSSIVF